MKNACTIKAQISMPTEEELFYADKVTLVTDAATDLGKKLIIRLAKLGANVVFSSPQYSENLSELEKEVQNKYKTGFYKHADISKKPEREKLMGFVVDKFGKLDILINNFESILTKKTSELTPEELQKQIENNVFGAVFLTQDALPHLKKHKGTIVSISSVKALYPSSGAYYFSKASAGLFFKNLKTELKKNKVNVLKVYADYSESSENTDRKIIDAIFGQRKKLILSFKGKYFNFVNNLFSSF